MNEILAEYGLVRGVATVTLNRPEKRNALNAPLVTALLAALERAREDPDARVVLLRGAGPDFCAGADIQELEESVTRSPEESLDDASLFGDLLLRIRRHPLPVVAMVRGRALGGGCGLASGCDIVLAHEEAEFGYPEIRLGFVAAVVMAILARKVLQGAAFELVATGTRIAAPEARRIGLVNHVLPDGDFETEGLSFVRGMAELPPSAARLTKRLFYSVSDTSLEEDIARAVEVNVLARQTAAFREGVRRFLGEGPSQ